VEVLRKLLMEVRPEKLTNLSVGLGRTGEIQQSTSHKDSPLRCLALSIPIRIIDITLKLHVAASLNIPTG
jgi:hypothetical protein